MMSNARVGAAIVLAVVGIGTMISAGKLWENVPASDYVVIQSPVAGDLTWRTTPGVAWQGFGDVTSYKIRMMYDFRANGYAVQFNDGGHGVIFGSIQCDLPSSIDMLTPMHRKFPTQEQVENGLVKTSTEGAIYLVGTLMSSRESYAEKKNDLIHYVTDQVQNGPYRTRQKREWVKDPVTNENKEVIAAEIVIGKDGNPERQEKSTLSQYGLRCYQFIVNRMAYDPAIEQQIKQQQAITMNVQTSVADKVLAEQRAQTAEASGRANATEAKWKQETIKAQAVTLAEQEKQVQTTNAERGRVVAVIEAERNKQAAEIAANQRLIVADLERKAPEQTKLQQILLGEGEAARKKLVIEADGALEAKLAAYTAVMPKIFEAMKGTAFVPSIVMGSNGNAQATNATGLIDLLTAKTAKDLALDLTLPAKK